VLLAVTFEACHYDPSQSEREESHPLSLEGSPQATSGEGRVREEVKRLTFPLDINLAKRGFDFGRPYDIINARRRRTG
jgi:hypothetical protein